MKKEKTRIDKSHDEQVERWARFCKDNPEEFRKHLKKFLDSQVIVSRKFYERLNKEKDCKKIIAKLKSVK